ncbi:hypothetical protein CACET_c22130 [Clostridium aceticum]|uniref:Uncharacterized protein n=1 Tax=Clostridium aceticum TaxID=84022 RepID=A0A0D8IC25_9CLOT|nr:hypothetical protein [Clostridium aceticum]AKL95659.1 hypothetical protein CACET_c22130 [Clostridium aceticum]KJF26776.1 hypothetical protein TZ02_11200 [Clostridium aceticum]
MDSNKQDGKQGFDIWKYGQLIIVALIIFVGMKFVFPGGNSIFGPNEGTLSAAALEYYVENYGEIEDSEEVKAVVRNFGCHREVHIYKDGELIMKMIYANGQMQEIS